MAFNLHIHNKDKTALYVFSSNGIYIVIAFLIRKKFPFLLRILPIVFSSMLLYLMIRVQRSISKNCGKDFKELPGPTVLIVSSFLTSTFTIASSIICESFYTKSIITLISVELFIEINGLVTYMQFLMRLIQLFFLAYYYLDERIQKQQFIEKHMLIQRLQDCYFILKENIPSSILILKS